jgi:hypothetical protein
MSTLKTQFSNHPVTDNVREAEMFRLTFDKNWDMFIEIDIYEKNSQGQRLFDIASNIPEKEKRDAAQRTTQPIRIDKDTKDVLVDAQGNIVKENGVMSEKDFMFQITNAQLLQATGKTLNDSALETIQEFVKIKMQEINARNIV